MCTQPQALRLIMIYNSVTTTSRFNVDVVTFQRNTPSSGRQTDRQTYGDRQTDRQTQSDFVCLRKKRHVPARWWVVESMGSTSQIQSKHGRLRERTHDVWGVCRRGDTICVSSYLAYL